MVGAAAIKAMEMHGVATAVTAMVTITGLVMADSAAILVLGMDTGGTVARRALDVGRGTKTPIQCTLSSASFSR